MKRGLESESGQGAIEYILILIIIVSMALGILYQFNTAFAAYVDNYFGNYVACLLETGELPNLGAQQGVQCDAEFTEFDIANGREGPAPAGGGSSGRNGSGAANNDSNVDGGRNGDRGRDGEARSADDGAAGGRARRNRASNRFGGRGGRGATDAAGNPVTRVRRDGGENLDVAGGNAGANFGQGDGRRRRRKIRATGNFGGITEENQNQKKTKANVTVEDEGGDGRKRRIAVNNRKRPAPPPEDTPFTIGDFLRYLIIAAIIIAIVVFLGGQALQISREWD